VLNECVPATEPCCKTSNCSLLIPTRSNCALVTVLLLPHTLGPQLHPSPTIPPHLPLLLQTTTLWLPDSVHGRLQLMLSSQNPSASTPASVVDLEASFLPLLPLTCFAAAQAWPRLASIRDGILLPYCCVKRYSCTFPLLLCCGCFRCTLRVELRACHGNMTYCRSLCTPERAEKAMHTASTWW